MIDKAEQEKSLQVVNPLSFIEDEYVEKQSNRLVWVPKDQKSN